MTPTVAFDIDKFLFRLRLCVCYYNANQLDNCFLVILFKF